MEHNENDGVARLSDVEKTSYLQDSYLKELYAKIADLREKLMEEKIVSGQLEEISCGLQGRISVRCQRTEELGIDHFKEGMGQAESELANAKGELDVLSTEIFKCCNEMLECVENEAVALESTRNRFKTLASLKENVEKEHKQSGDLNRDIGNVESEIREVDNLGEELQNSMRSYGAIDGVIQNYLEELEETESEIAGLSLKLHVSHPSFAAEEDP